MDLDDLEIDDRIEVYTPSTGTYWGYVAGFGDTGVILDDVRPEGKPASANATDIVRRVFRGRRPEGHFGVWRGRGA